MDSPISSKTHWSLSLGGEPPSPLGEVLENYLTALERGAPPDRDALLAAHPEIANELRDCLAKLDALHAATAGLQASPGRAVVAPLKSSLAPSQLGDYRILRELGRGGMGVVYEAEQLTLGRRVALKTLPLTGLLDERRIARFKNESIAAASLNHPHIVPIYGVGCDAGVHFYAMQCIEGASLADVISQRQALKKGATNDTQPNAPTSTITSAVGSSFHRLVAEVGRQSADALHYAHEQSVIHRDIKPSNLLIDATGQVWVTDFGLAATQTELALTRTGELLGTLRYLSPEQASGDRPIDHRVDIYGLGVTLYELLSGKPAQSAEQRGQLLREVMNKEPPALRRVDPSIDLDLSTVVAKALAKDPRDRYVTAGDLAADLNRFLEQKPVFARRPGPWRRMTSWIRRNRLVTLLLSVIICLLTFAAIAGFASAWNLAEQQRKLQISLYARDIAVAHQLIQRGERVRAEELLLKWATTPERREMRDFEWSYLWRRCKESESDAVLRFPADAYDVIVLEDHGRIATSAFGTTIAMWDAKTFEVMDDLAIATPHESEITKLAADPSEQILASGGAGGRVCLWRVADGNLLDQFRVDDPAHGRGVLDLAFSPDGRYLAASTRDQLHDRLARDLTVYLWNLQQRRIVQRLEGLGANPCVSFAPSGDLYITSLSGEVEVWTCDQRRDQVGVEPWEQTDQRVLGNNPIWCSDLTADGKRLVTCSCSLELRAYSRFEVWDTANWLPVTGVDARAPGSCFEVDVHGSRWALAGDERGYLTLLDLEARSIVAARKVHHGPIFGLHISEDGDLLCSASRDNTIRFWDRQRFASLARSTRVERVSGAEVSAAVAAAAGEGVYIAHHNGEVVEWDVSSRETAGRIDVSSQDANRTSIDASPDNRWLAVVRGRWPVGGIAHVEVHACHQLGTEPSRQWRAELPDGAMITRPRFSPDSRMLAVPSLEEIRLYSTASGKVLKQLPLPWVFALGFSRDGRWFAAARGERTHIFRTSDWTKLLTLQTAEPRMSTRGIDFSPDGLILATSDEQHRVTLWDIRSGQSIRRSEPLSDFITALAYSPNGRRIAAVTKDGAINLMHSETLDLQLTLPIPASWTFHGGFSADGSRFVVGGNRVCSVYDAGGMEELERLNIRQLRGPAYYKINAATDNR